MRSVCTYLRPLHSGRLLDTPRHAARFVSLIPLEQPSTGLPQGSASMGGGGGGGLDDLPVPSSASVTQYCPSAHAFLSANKGVRHLCTVLVMHTYKLG